MWIEPKRGLDQKREINASVFEARLLTCSKVPGDLRIFIAAPLMIQQVQKYPGSDTTLPLTCQIRIRLSHQKEIPPHTQLPATWCQGVKRLRVSKASDLSSLHHCHQHGRERSGEQYTCLPECIPFFCFSQNMRLLLKSVCGTVKSMSK